MSTHPEKSEQIRTYARRAVGALSVGILGLALLPAVALADTPSSAPDAPHVSGLQYIVVLVLIPAGLFAVVSLLAALPSMISDKGYEPGQSWRSEPEWFGGPRKGVEAADDVPATAIEASETDRGGTSGTW
ncbi:MAG: hypothetical protein EOO67_15775 [Microbacterium sp.]|nr:MAG: hypothetical protein EOO67_15775 [Microbacterium sp.]